MFCQSCSSLSFLYTKKKCVRCTGEINNNLSIICDSCSLKDKACSVCLKKTDGFSNKNKNIGNCRCGKK